ncbi:MAG: ABC transporter permease [Clostridia bacterium]
MMSFKLALRSMKKNMKDYVIYFITLVLGVAIFYIFNSMDAQQAMIQMSESKREIMSLMIQMLEMVSVFVSLVLGFLIVYANNFLIKRRKKEFGLYMTLGMGKGQISKILLIETILVGLFSLGVGLVVGVFASQLMSALVAKMFEADMRNYQFVFSQAAMIKTILYFAVIYLVVILLNMFAISRYKLIDLLTANKKNEKVKIKSSILSVILFLVSIAILGYAYHLAITEIYSMEADGILKAIALGCVGTFLFFYSLSGFALKLVQSRKRWYERDLNMFVMRQIDSKINTTTISMSVICVLLFLTICIFSSAISLNNSLTDQLKTYTPVDITITKISHIPENEKGHTKEETDRYHKTIAEVLEELAFDYKANFSEYVEVNEYTTEQVTFEKLLGDTLEEVKNQFPHLKTSSNYPIMRVSDYNQVAKLFGIAQVSVKENEYTIVGNYEEMTSLLDESLRKHTPLHINGKTYYPNTKEHVDGFVSISSQATETGVVILPDEAVDTNWRSVAYLNAKYNGTTEEEKQEMENKIVSLGDGDGTVNTSSFKDMMAMSKITLYETSKGLSATVTFIGLYLGIVFLISSAAILALKELSDTSDNQERYCILRKIGVDEKMINRALFKQIGIFFMMPLLLAIIHSIFGLKVAHIILATLGKQDLMASIITTAIFIVLIYGAYFIATYFGSKNIIKEE